MEPPNFPLVGQCPKQLRRRIKRGEMQNVQNAQAISWKNLNAQDVWYVYKRIKLR